MRRSRPVSRQSQLSRAAAGSNCVVMLVTFAPKASGLTVITPAAVFELVTGTCTVNAARQRVQRGPSASKRNSSACDLTAHFLNTLLRCVRTVF